jgi:tripartite-type tricarboxylate transporter receptor subunit TctC
MLVGFAAGGGTDLMARLIQQSMSEKLGQQLVVENRPGAGTNIATEAVVHAAPDGYTLLAASLANAGNATLYSDLKFNFIRDTVPIAGIALDPFVLQVTPSLPVKTLPELIAYAKANPGKVNYGSGGIGSGNQLTAEMLKSMAGIDLVHVPYRGAGPAMVDLMGGQVQVMFNTMGASLQHVRGGKLRAIAVATKARQAALPDVPTVADVLAGLRGELLDRRRGAQGHAGRGRRQGQQGGQCGARRGQREGPSRRVGRHRAHRLARRLRQVRRRRDREVGQGHPQRQHQGGVRFGTTSAPGRKDNP